MQNKSFKAAEAEAQWFSNVGEKLATLWLTLIYVAPITMLSYYFIRSSDLTITWEKISYFWSSDIPLAYAVASLGVLSLGVSYQKKGMKLYKQLDEQIEKQLENQLEKPKTRRFQRHLPYGVRRF